MTLQTLQGIFNVQWNYFYNDLKLQPFGNSVGIGYAVGTALPSLLSVNGTSTLQKILPSTTNAYDLGSSTQFWKNLFAYNINSDGLDVVIDDTGVPSGFQLRVAKGFSCGWAANFGNSNKYTSPVDADANRAGMFYGSGTDDTVGTVDIRENNNTNPRGIKIGYNSTSDYAVIQAYEYGSGGEQRLSTSNPEAE